MLCPVLGRCGVSFLPPSFLAPSGYTLYQRRTASDIVMALRKGRAKTVRRVHLLAASSSFAEASVETVLQRRKRRLVGFVGELLRENELWAEGVKTW